MADRNVNRALDENLPVAVSDLGDGGAGGGTPYAPSRTLGSLLSGVMRLVRYLVTPGTTVDDAGNTIASTDDILLDVGFNPLLVMIHCADANEYDITHHYGSTNGIKVLNAGAISQGAFCSFPSTGIVTIEAASLTNAKAHTIIVMG